MTAGALEYMETHHQRRLAHLDRSQALPHAARAGHAKAVRGQVVEQKGASRLVVLNDEKRAQIGHSLRRAARKNLAPGRRTRIRERSCEAIVVRAAWRITDGVPDPRRAGRERALGSLGIASYRCSSAPERGFSAAVARRSFVA